MSVMVGNEVGYFRRLDLVGPGQVAWFDGRQTPLEPDRVRVQSLLSGIKHGTEMVRFAARDPHQTHNFDMKTRVFIPREGPARFPTPVGSMTVGRVVEVGTDVTSVKPGDVVFGLMGLQDIQTTPAEHVQPLGTLTPEQAVCVDPAFFAASAVRDARAGIGDRVAVLGLGAIGLFVVQLAKLAGAEVIAASRFPRRCELAREFGADRVIDTRHADDLGLLVKTESRGGVDVAIECSGDYARLHQAIRMTRQNGRVVAVGFYIGDGKDLRLGEEFFHNQLTLVASLPSWRWQNPSRDYPRWDPERLRIFVVESFRAGKLRADGMLQPVLSFADAVEALPLIAREPESVVKIGIRY
jgi:threonine dehydrogenase-like Zn-dependent dehydrogenase